MDIYELRAKRLSAAIEKSGLSYVELEKITGVSKSSIQRYASGKTKKIPIESLEKIAHAIGADTKYLMGWEDIAPYKAGHEEPPPPNAEYMLDDGKTICLAVDVIKNTEQGLEHRLIAKKVNAKKPPPEEGGIYPVEMTESELEKFRERLMTLNPEERDDLSTFLDFLDFRRNGGR